MLVKMDIEIDSFPAEMINHLFSLFTFNEGKQYRQICKRWRDIFDNIILDDKQTIYCKLFLEKIDLSTHKSLHSFFNSLTQLSHENTESIIQAYINREKDNARKKVNKEVRSFFSCHFLPCTGQNELTEEERQADLTKCDLIWWSTSSALFGLMVGVLVFLTTLLTTPLKSADSVFFLIFSLLSMFSFSALFGALVPASTSLSSVAYPAITSQRAASSAREFLTFYRQEPKNATDLIIEIPEEDNDLGIHLDQGLSSTSLV
jgi:hypothetical protein